MEENKVIEIRPEEIDDLVPETKSKVKYKVMFRWIGDGSTDQIPVNNYSDLKMKTVSIIHSVDKKLVGVVSIDKKGECHPYEIPKKWNNQRKVAAWIV